MIMNKPQQALPMPKNTVTMCFFYKPSDNLQEQNLTNNVKVTWRNPVYEFSFAYVCLPLQARPKLGTLKIYPQKQCPSMSVWNVAL